MKWRILIASLVMSVGLCAQGFGFELLDQLLGVHGHGCHVGCCVKPSCGFAVPSCGCAAPLRGCAPKCCAPKPRCKPGPLFGHCCKPNCGCGAPTCGCAPPAWGAAHPYGCAPFGLIGGILKHLFICHKRCCQPACGCAPAWGYRPDAPSYIPAEQAPEVPGEGVPATPGNAASAPLPINPIVDPAAFVPKQRTDVKTVGRLIVK